MHEKGESCAAAAAHMMAIAGRVGVGTHMSALTPTHTLQWLPTGSPDWVV